MRTPRKTMSAPRGTRLPFRHREKGRKVCTFKRHPERAWQHACARWTPPRVDVSTQDQRWIIQTLEQNAHSARQSSDQDAEVMPVSAAAVALSGLQAIQDRPHTSALP
jgi:hypothetical protein